MLTQQQLHIMQHSLGLNEHGLDSKGGTEGYRNHYVASPGHYAWEDLMSLVDAGLMIKRSPNAVTDTWFSVTDSGRAAVIQNSPPPPKVSRAKQRYQRFLDFGDSFNSFIEFCRWDADPERSWNKGGAA